MFLPVMGSIYNTGIWHIIMIDKYSRNIDYMRISITDRCNLRCKYCMPTSNECVQMGDIMTCEEILKVAKAASLVGIRKIKVTGGEPLVRKDCVSIIERLKDIQGIQDVTITTNGLLLKSQIDRLVRAGVDGINISLDTMNPDKYRFITGSDRHSDVLDAIHCSVDSGIKTKVNAVSLCFDENDSAKINTGRLPDDTKRLVGLARDLEVDVRFIEMMPIGQGKNHPAIPHDLLKQALHNEYQSMTVDEKAHGNGPSLYYRIDDFKGSVGLISAIHGKFCSKCNRIRLTAKGGLKSCLCYNEDANLLPILRSNSDDNLIRNKLIETMTEVITNKPMQHCFDTPEDITEKNGMVAIGG